MPRRSVVLLLVLGGVARAQSLSLSLGSTAVVKNGGDCTDRVSGTWATSSLGTVCSELRIWLTASSSCDDAPGSSDVVVETVDQATLGSSSSGSFSFKVSELPSFSGNTHCGDAVDVTDRVCGALKRQSSSGSCDSTVQASGPTVRVDAKPPGAPGVSVQPLDGKVRVDLTPASEDDADDVTRFFVDLAVDPGDGGVPSWRNVGGEVGSRTTVTGLQNGVRYLFRGVAIDEAGNRGPASDPVAATPVASSGFWERYQNSNGTDVGCGGGAVLGGALSTLAARRRRRQ